MSRAHMVLCSLFFFFNDTATTEIYTLSLHDALPISHVYLRRGRLGSVLDRTVDGWRDKRIAVLARDSIVALDVVRDRKSTRLNSSHSQISYAVFCLKKKKKKIKKRPHVRHQRVTRTV